MDTRSRLLGSILVSLSFLAACISSAGIGTPPGANDDGGVGGSPEATGGASSVPVVTTGGTPPITSAAGGTVATTTGGSPTLATGGSPVLGAGGTVSATGGMSSVGTAGSCDFTKAACTNPCGSLVQWQQTPCASYLTCMQANSACVKAADPICATAGSFGNPTCSDLYSLSGANDALATYMKCVCGLT